MRSTHYDYYQTADGSLYINANGRVLKTISGLAAKRVLLRFAGASPEQIQLWLQQLAARKESPRQRSNLPA